MLTIRVLSFVQPHHPLWINWEPDHVPAHMKSMCINRTTQFNQNIIQINCITSYPVHTQTEIHVALTPTCVIAQLDPCHT